MLNVDTELSSQVSMTVKATRGRLLRATWWMFEVENRDGNSGWGRLPGFPSATPLPPDLCAVSVSSNEMVGGDIEVLADTRKHERERH